MQKNVCKMCGKALSGRIDKQFCSVYCKNEYHLKLRRATAKEVVAINGILARNRSVLLELLGKNLSQKKISRLELDRKKFNFKYLLALVCNECGLPFLLSYIFSLIINYKWSVFIFFYLFDIVLLSCFLFAFCFMALVANEHQRGYIK
jgi:hypothetical protein